MPNHVTIVIGFSQFLQRRQGHGEHADGQHSMRQGYEPNSSVGIQVSHPQADTESGWCCCSGVNATVSTPSADNSTASGNAISCTEPSLVIIKTPAIYTSAYTSAAEFTGKVRHAPNRVEMKVQRGKPDSRCADGRAAAAMVCIAGHGCSNGE